MTERTDASEPVGAEPSPPEALHEAAVGFDPWALFGAWFEHALASGAPEPTAMVLATVGEDGQPSARMVLLKGYDPRGLVFYTNYESRKARDLEHDPRAALTFFWPTLHRQVRVEGLASRVPAAESDAYFATRDRGSRIGAWASPQSVVLASREALVRRIEEATRRFEGRAEVPRPWYWGGYRLVPEQWEFWQARESRLHDRFRFRRQGDAWRRERLAP
jgi:pyridoxamine 5'-phosphate oxidase